jgi:hypothetical protein
MEYSWKLITDIKPGDYVNRWGDDLEVVLVEPASVMKGGGYRLVVFEKDGKTKDWYYSERDELWVRQ